MAGLVPGCSRVRPLSRRLLETLVTHLGCLRSEVMLELPFGEDGRLIGQVVCTAGGVAAIRAACRPLLRRTQACGATGLLLVHNHPSGDPRPSRADVIATRGLSMLCRSARIEFYDHLVIGGRARSRCGGRT
ncbi:hypothetical protein ADT71_02425 [Novosphingobium sp. ST904]|nr:hypothetical protein ADT71_02425 [Novosphingobium sp. ST904]